MQSAAAIGLTLRMQLSLAETLACSLALKARTHRYTQMPKRHSFPRSPWERERKGKGLCRAPLLSV
ncbi:hypothetical protein Mettu_0282 [Methylobacter tundripaludum SV96]|uniref:Uncharacterized protein n=1 Tax=Methylobacter tundripaludum (strain ATCC BAA-1195 / DSM 17260 / SV96) TaxID=697282 RepID=G3IUA7_METTV|nr:hypothetical protein Mettu_0282 [Methylobacter tundripaludum SV96]